MAGRIVVGVDGSDGARRALDHALEEARLRGAKLDVVHAYQAPVPWSAAGFVAPVPMPSRNELAEAAEQVLDEVIGHPPPDVDIERIVCHGAPATVLLEVAKGADLLVVGSRGLGGFRGLLLGSTSHHVVTHAPCPVVVIPASPGRTARPSA